MTPEARKAQLEKLKELEHKVHLAQQEVAAHLLVMYPINQPARSKSLKAVRELLKASA